MSDDTQDPRVELLTTNAGSRLVAFACPGCGCNHILPVGGQENGPIWRWNESISRPTINPSIRMRTTKMTVSGEAQYREWMDGKIPVPEHFDSIPVVCHSFVRDGRIEFLGDCTHSLAGTTVEMEAIE